MTYPLTRETGQREVPLPWVRLDTSFPRNHKLLALLQEKDGYRAALVYLCSLSYSGEQGTAGFITELALPFIHGRKTDADRLVKHDFWQPCPGGWLIHDWGAHQAAGEEAEARKKRAQDAAWIRWHGRDGALCRRTCASNAPRNAQAVPQALRRTHMQRTDGRTD